MAITQVLGTLNPSSSTKARDIRQAFATAFSGIAGWTLLDHNYINGTSERSVLVNDNGFAFMIYNSTTTSTLTVSFAMGQSYNDSTHVMTNPAIGAGTITTTATGFSGQTFNPTAVTSSPGSHGVKSYNATANQTDWSAHIDSNYAVLSFKDGTTTNGKALYVGAVDTLIENPSITDGHPYVMTFNDTNAGVTLISAGNFSVSHAWSAIAFPILNVGTPAQAGTADFYNINPTLVATSPIFVARSSIQPSTTDSSLYGWLKGTMKGVLFGYSTNATWGDTSDFGTTTFMYVGGSTTNAWWVAVE